MGCSVKIRNLLYLCILIAACFSCTRVIEEQDAGKNTIASNDGCVYCHTNQNRLKVLAPPVKEEGGAGGG